ncbi:condensin-2 complex subunit H2 isoform A [Patagioenas fasciata monilis]|uniref:Condensin-2 complex subunit H2 n=1 Tax=Patagioenas fasciata monilis TaxID=372326 RepID=A0A1V4K4E7_PATFA|nr:condensin-2 complex subunit H2 isoform A [Patagioenas fasciata monilis]
MADVELRFQHLLQPIRDLTKNWEVDVASQLEEYLEELEHVCVSFDNGKTTMNFTEAAMLIQGSACIYSRKVEHLYLLVYQVLDLFSNKKREKLPSSLRPDGTDADATFGEQQQEFLSLDDIKDSSQASTDMRKDHQPNSVNIVPLTPMSLVPPEDVEKKDNPLFSRTRELLASRRDFRMNACTPHATGTCLLELSGLPPAHPCSGNPRGAAGAQPCVPGSEHGSISEDPVRALNFSEDEGAAALDGDIGGGDDAPGALEDDMEMPAVAEEHVEAQKRVPRARERAPVEDPNAHIKELLDPWQSLDPFGDSEDKPFRKGRPFLVPHGLDDVVGGKRKRKGPRKLQDFMKWFSASYTDGAGSRKPKSKGPTFADLEMLYWKQLKQRVVAQRKLQCQERSLWPPLCEEKPDPLEELLRGDSEDGADDFLEHDDILAEGPEELGDRDVALDSSVPGSLCYADLVRRNVELFIASSQQFAQETELSQRVRRWEEQMEPLLQQQEERASFDIHGYGEALAEGCGAPGAWHPFSALVAGQPPFEVCRYMLAALQLANDTVVELAQEVGLEQAVDTMRLRLLAPPQPHDRFQALQPSLGGP